MNSMVESFYGRLAPDEKERLRAYIKKRFEDRKSSDNMGVVFDILHDCILHCQGCGTDARYVEERTGESCGPAMEQIEQVFRKLRQYEDESGTKFFLNIGGGEPFLRQDILEILHLASEFFGAENVGIDTNAALPDSPELISEAMRYVSYVGISINGLQQSHNWWAGNHDMDVFSNATRTIRALCANPANREKIEVTSVATKKNIAELPALIPFLADIGVKKYSVHRAIPVGRMAFHQDLIPDANEYLDLWLSLIQSAASVGMQFHMHHSIESIHAALFLGIDTYEYDHIGNPDALSSIGIDPECNVVFDPWCTTGYWKNLSSGNLLSDPRSLNDMLHAPDSVFQKTAECTSQKNRCNGCAMHCSGGSRIVAAAHALCGHRAALVSVDDVYTAMRAVDPACPLYSGNPEN